jgi:Xaa-Pro dipeptidase
VRDHLTAAGYGDAFVHRTGHSLGTRTTHGEAAHLDDFETRDVRRLTPGFGITVEPGVYLPEFGVRSELDVVLEATGPRVTTGVQIELERV